MEFELFQVLPELIFWTFPDAQQLFHWPVIDMKRTRAHDAQCMTHTALFKQSMKIIA